MHARTHVTHNLQVHLAYCIRNHDSFVNISKNTQGDFHMCLFSCISGMPRGYVRHYMKQRNTNNIILEMVDYIKGIQTVIIVAIYRFRKGQLTNFNEYLAHIFVL